MAVSATRVHAPPLNGRRVRLVIVIRNSRLLLGCVDKSVLGANGKTNVFYMLLRDCSEAAAALAMARLARLTSYYLSESLLFAVGVTLLVSP